MSVDSLGNKDFDTHFPILMSEMNNFDERVNLEELREIKNWEISSKRFYGEAMIEMLNRVDAEIFAVLGQHWVKLKQ